MASKQSSRRSVTSEKLSNMASSYLRAASSRPSSKTPWRFGSPGPRLPSMSAPRIAWFCPRSRERSKNLQKRRSRRGEAADPTTVRHDANELGPDSSLSSPGKGRGEEVRSLAGGTHFVIEDPPPHVGGYVSSSREVGNYPRYRNALPC